MNSILDPSFVYDDISKDVTEHDINVVSDVWSMDGRDVYRGSRDPRYTHANVYWLYDVDLNRVGLCEHSLTDHAVFHILWIYDCDFATYFQEEDWTMSDDIWSVLSKNAFEKFFHSGWTTPTQILEMCLKSDVRPVTLDMIRNPPNVYSCESCHCVSLKPICASNQVRPLDFPKKEKVFFVDDDLVIYIPPPNSQVFKLLRLGDDDSLEQVQVQEQVMTPRDAPLPDAPLPQ